MCFKRKKEEKDIIYEMFTKELEEALVRYETALKSFETAEEDYVEIAVDKLRAAELEVNAAYKKLKKLNKCKIPIEEVEIDG